ncbi:PilZ domain-containing protein [Acetanaerobacterium elongatum]|uniref:PilZ domain-containing protein n=1 Tax=Acetanaerobacterium elongatum TaxID=258515 RepID=A0A1G9ZE18_9FIRM|nr:PilZ domain-containing protein [Acetanaerobacterium elongatum]SDN19425.1 PilZ domain-containing protein [Acetanaerobacterium elongatum]
MLRTVHQKVEIYSKKDALITTGVLVDVTDHNMEILGDIFPHFDTGETLKVCAYDDMKGICWYSAIVSFSAIDRIILTDYHLLDVIQRRKSIKVKTTFETNIYIVYDVDENKITLENPIKIVVRDISAGGIFFTADQIFFEGNQFEFYFNQGPKHLRIKTLILRRQDMNNGKKGYGCSFIDATEKEQDILFAFLWEVQRLQLKRMQLNS